MSRWKKQGPDPELFGDVKPLELDPETIAALERLLDRSDAAHYLGVSVDVLDRIARRGVLRRRVLPETRCIRYDVRDLDRLVDQS